MNLGHCWSFHPSQCCCPALQSSHGGLGSSSAPQACTAMSAWSRPSPSCRLLPTALRDSFPQTVAKKLLTAPRPSTLRHWELRSHLGYLRFNMRCQNQAMLPGVANCKALMLNTSTGEQCLALEMTSEKKKAMADTVLQPHSSSALA